MTLNRQFWYVIIAVLTVSFIASFLVTTYSAVRLFEQQLAVKNTDNANVLAQTLSAMDKDPTLLELAIAAQFDTGFYQHLQLTDTQGNMIVNKAFKGEQTTSAPAWFEQWVSIDARPATALVQDGWQQYGTLTVESQKSYVLDALWQRTLNLLVIFLAVAILAAIIGRALLRGITRPLSALVQQADAIGAGQYEENPRLPRTTDLKRLVIAMNKMTVQIRQSFQREVTKLAELQQQLDTDALTGVYNRDYVVRQLTSQLHDLAHEQNSYVVLVDVGDLRSVNDVLGRRTTDHWLCAIATHLLAVAEKLNNSAEATVTVGRLNASEFVLVVSDIVDPDTVKQKIAKQLSANTLPNTLSEPLAELTNAQTAGIEPHWCVIAERMLVDDRVSDLLMRIDSQLTRCLDRGRADGSANQSLEHVLFNDSVQKKLFDDHQGWRDAFENALTQQLVSMDYYPVVSRDGEILHYEGMMRVVLKGQRRSAKDFISWARRLGFIEPLELAAIEHTIANIAKRTNQLPRQPLAVNLSSVFLVSADARAALIARLRAAGHSYCQQLTFEWSEKTVLAHPAAFGELCVTLTQLGCSVGIDHMQYALNSLPDFTRLGLRYLKLDRALLVNLEDSSERSKIVAKIRDIAKALGIAVIAEGIEEPEQAVKVDELQLDGYTGPAVSSK